MERGRSSADHIETRAPNSSKRPTAQVEWHSFRCVRQARRPTPTHRLWRRPPALATTPWGSSGTTPRAWRASARGAATASTARSGSPTVRGTPRRCECSARCVHRTAATLQSDLALIALGAKRRLFGAFGPPPSCECSATVRRLSCLAASHSGITVARHSRLHRRWIQPQPRSACR